MNSETPEMSIPCREILDSMNIGVYVTDIDRKIIYWGKAAQEITGWSTEEVVGRHCNDDLLCHIDKDGHKLCGFEHCPLHRAMITGQSSHVPIIVFAQKKDGGRVPLHVSVSPLRDRDGKTIGGVETFRDLSKEIEDIERVRTIQKISLMDGVTPSDDNISFSVHYIPHDIIGGDYYAATRINDSCYGFMLADVMGHGFPAALYTMCLGSHWNTYRHLLASPLEFVDRINKSLHPFTGADGSFAAAVCGVFDLERGEMRLVGAGNPAPVIFRADGSIEKTKLSGGLIGIMKDAVFKETVIPIRKGDCILFFTDGAVEIANETGICLDTDGLTGILKGMNYPGKSADFQAIETEMLKASNHIRFDDDVTFLEVRIGSFIQSNN